MEKCIDPNGLPDDVARMLFEAWIIVLSGEKFGFSQSQYSTSGNRFHRNAIFGSPVENHFSLDTDGLTVTLNQSVGVRQIEVEKLVDTALEKVATKDFGGTVVYTTEMSVKEPQFTGPGEIHFMRVLGDQVHIEGPRRLSDVVLLDFEEGLLNDVPVGGLLFAPPSKVQVTVFVPGPCSSDLTQRSAAGIVELVAAICALATGRPILYRAPPFPAADSDAATALRRKRDPAILGLARDSVSLDVFGDLQALGGTDALLRVRGSLLAYHAALTQASPDVAVMLFVTCIEALISPRATWGKEKVTQRFIKSLIQMCPDAVDELLRHSNTEEAFGFSRRGGQQRQRRDLLSLIYETRSLPTHTGLALSPAGFAGMGAAENMRVALLSDLARAAILSYLQAPRCSIIGHPSLDFPSDDQTRKGLAPDEEAY